MHKLTQTLHDPENGVRGNCFETALAGILHIPVSEIPVFPDTLAGSLAVSHRGMLASPEAIACT